MGELNFTSLHMCTWLERQIDHHQNPHIVMGALLSPDRLPMKLYSISKTIFEGAHVHEHRRLWRWRKTYKSRNNLFTITPILQKCSWIPTALDHNNKGSTPNSNVSGLSNSKTMTFQRAEATSGPKFVASFQELGYMHRGMWAISHFKGEEMQRIGDMTVDGWLLKAHFGPYSPSESIHMMYLPWGFIL